MTGQELKKFVERYLAVLRRDKSEAALREYIAEEPLLQHIAFFSAAFPDYWLEAEDMIAEDDRVAVRFTFHGTHKSELMGIPPTGKMIDFAGIIIYRVADGKIVDHWMQIDNPSLMQQLGAIPATA